MFADAIPKHADPKALYRHLIAVKETYAKDHYLVYDPVEDKFKAPQLSRRQEFIQGKEDPRLLHKALNIAEKHRRALNQEFDEYLSKLNVDQNTAIRTGIGLATNNDPNFLSTFSKSLAFVFISGLGLINFSRYVDSRNEFTQHPLVVDLRLAPSGVNRTPARQLHEANRLCAIRFENEEVNKALPDFLIYKITQHIPAHQSNRSLEDVPEVELTANPGLQTSAEVIEIEFRPQTYTRPNWFDEARDYLDGDGSSVGLKPGMIIRLPEPFGYKIIDDIWGLERIGSTNKFRVIEFIPPHLPIKYSAIKTVQNFSKLDVPIIPEEEFTKEEQELRKIIRLHLIQKPYDINSLEKFLNDTYILGQIPPDQVDFPVRQSIYLLPYENSNLEQLVKSMTLDELREFKIGQCELFTYYVSRLLNGILPTAFACGRVQDSFEQGVFTPHSAHVRLLVEGPMKNMALYEVTVQNIIRQNVDITEEEKDDLSQLLNSIRNENNESQRQKLIDHFRNILCKYSQI